jgi:hypothetical protein
VTRLKLKQFKESLQPLVGADFFLALADATTELSHHHHYQDMNYFWAAGT